MTVNHTLRLLRQYAGSVRWSFDNPNRQYIAIHGDQGMRVTISPAISRHELMNFAMDVQKELVKTYRKNNTPFGKFRRKLRAKRQQ